jgi:hypothetical protein
VAEKSMKDLRDELVMRMIVTHAEFLLNHPELVADWSLILKDSFAVAEHFLAARYDADTSGLYKKPPPSSP